MIDEFNMMIVGVGGTGVLTLSRIIGNAAVLEGLRVRIGEVHGMAQRGGSVFAEVRIGEKVYSPIIPQGRADILLGLEPVETLRSIYKASERSIVVVNTHPIIPPLVSLGFAEYPSITAILEKIKLFTSNILACDGTEIARQLGNPRVLNLVMLGVAFSTGKIPLSQKTIERSIRDVIPQKYVNINIKAFREGISEGKKLLK